MIQEQKLCQRALDIGEKTLTKFKEALQDRCPIIGDVRGLGAMIGIELVKDKKTKEPAKNLRQK